jgi:hypothetical protein
MVLWFRRSVLLEYCLATIVYVGLHAMFVGGMVAVITVLAKPKWL